MLRTMSTSYLPEAILENILSRLPPKTLIRFRCVSKTWLALIGNPDFLSKNILNHSILVPNNTAQNPNPPFLLVKAFNNQKLICNFLSYDTLDCLFHIQVQLDLPIVASCHGLVCLYDGRCQEIEAEVYRVGSGSWRQIDLGPVIFGFQWVSTTYTNGFPWVSTTYMNGVFFWWTKQEVGDKIIAFDFSDEIFKTTPLPEIGNADTNSSKLTVLNSFVAILVMTFDHKVNWGCYERWPHSVDIWVLLEFGVKESWNKLFTITAPSTWRRSLGFWKNGELFIENCYNQLVLYDPFTKIEKNLQLNGIEEYFGSFPNYFQVFPYTQKEDTDVNP
ncbi:putative f-box protein [Quercus suber]|uniref:F-box protein n=1 Tax=Quercus suber TaxID=58331 RepID=A0AAW0KGX7_QUESU